MYLLSLSFLFIDDVFYLVRNVIAMRIFRCVNSSRCVLNQQYGTKQFTVGCAVIRQWCHECHFRFLYEPGRDTQYITVRSCANSAGYHCRLMVCLNSDRLLSLPGVIGGPLTADCPIL